MRQTLVAGALALSLGTVMCMLFRKYLRNGALKAIERVSSGMVGHM